MAGIDANATLVLHCNDTSLIDSSNTGHTMTLNGNIARSSTQSKFGGFSAYCDGSTDYLSAADHALWDLGTGDGTFEGFFRWDAVTDTSHLLFDRGDATPYAFFSNSGNNLLCQFNGGVRKTEAASLSINTWYHIAFVRSGTDLMIFKDGTQLGTATTNSESLDGTAGIAIGAQQTGGGAGFAGFFDEVRWSNIARYTANFTPPSAEFSVDIMMTSWYRGHILQPDTSRGLLII